MDGSQWEENSGETLIAEEGNGLADTLELFSTGKEEEHKQQRRWKCLHQDPSINFSSLETGGGAGEGYATGVDMFIRPFT